MHHKWSVIWKEQPIVVEAWQNWLWIKAELWVGDFLVDRHKSCFWFADSTGLASECLAAPVVIANQVHKIEVLMAQGTFRPYCHTLVDHELVGGDVTVKLQPRNFTAWKKAHSKGIGHFLIKYGGLLSLEFALMGAFFAVLCSLIYPHEAHLLWVIVQWGAWGSLSGLFFALLFGSVAWWVQGRLYSASFSHHKKLDAPPQHLTVPL